MFDPDLREDLAGATRVWIQEVSELLGQVRPMAAAAALTSAAERLTALVEGLSSRWLSGSLPLAHARELMVSSIAAELDRLARTA